MFIFARGEEREKRRQRKYIELGERTRKSVAMPSVLEKWEDEGNSKSTVFYM